MTDSNVDNNVFGAGGVPEDQKTRYFDLFEVDGWQGVWNPRPERYDDQNDEHKKLAAKGLTIFYEYSFIPVGTKGQVITRTSSKNSREWREIFNSLKEYWGMTDDAAVSQKIGETFHVQHGGGYIARELVDIGKYTSKTTGEEKTKWASKIVDVFTDENAAVSAHDEFYNITSDIPGFDDTEKPTGFDDKSSAMLFLPEFVKMAMMSHGRVDRDKLAELIESSDVLKAHFTVQSQEVEDAINDAETEPPF